jgi:hypothetical protein
VGRATAVAAANEAIRSGQMERADGGIQREYPAIFAGVKKQAAGEQTLLMLALTTTSRSGVRHGMALSLKTHQLASF